MPARWHCRCAQACPFGAFPETLICPLMNFLNGEVGASERGGYLITNGGDCRAEYLIAELYLKYTKTLRAVYFTDPKAATTSLQYGGGIGCRTKSSEQPPPAM
jgi:hypothetical protein